MQKRRLQYAKKLVALLSELDVLLREEAKEKNAKEVKVEKALFVNGHLGGLPVPVRLRSDPKTRWNSNEFFTDEKKILEPNPDFMTQGFSCAKLYGLDFLNPQTKPIKEGGTQDFWKRYWRTNLDGSRTPYFVKADEPGKAQWGMWKDADIVFDEGLFIIKNDSFVKYENKN